MLQAKTVRTQQTTRMDSDQLRMPICCCFPPPRPPLLLCSLLRCLASPAVLENSTGDGSRFLALWRRCASGKGNGKERERKGGRGM
jgi:hypothetical protein